VTRLPKPRKPVESTTETNRARAVSTLLLIADIGGYTEYMRSHRMSLAHTEVSTAG
jgi:hypothetical protein